MVARFDEAPLRAKVAEHDEALWIANHDGTALYELTDIPGNTSYAWGTAPPS